MKPPIFVRELSEKERESLQARLRSRDTFVLRRCQIVLASARGNSPPKIAQSLGCASQTVRNAIRAFNEKGLDALIAVSSTPKRVHAAFDASSAEQLRGMLLRSPREFGYETSLWALETAAEAAFEEDLTEKRVSGRPSAPPSGVFWAYAGSVLNAGSPLPIPSTNEKRRHDRLMETADADPLWAIGFWTNAGGAGWRCLPRLDDIWIRFIDGRPVSSISTRFLSWCCEGLERVGKKTLLLIWDNASWHICREVRRWFGKHNREVKESGCGVRIVSCLLPKQSPWLNAIEPKWVDGKRKEVELDGLLGAYELADRVCGAFGCPHHEHLTIPQEDA